MSHVSQYHRSATYHTALVRKIYEIYLKSSNVKKNTPLSILDIGCGSGKILHDVLYPLLPKNFSELIGIDKDKSMIDYCKTIKIDPRISFEKFDISDENIPEKFKNRFSYLFSSFCLLYIENLRLALTNCHKLLKPNGEMIFVSLYKWSPVQYTHKEMSKMDKWKSYTAEYKDFVPLFSSTDPDSEIKDLFRGTGLKLLAYKFEDDKIIITRRKLQGLFQSMDRLYPLIPENDKDEYMEDFMRLSFNRVNVALAEKEKLDEDIEIFIPIVHMHAKK